MQATRACCLRLSYLLLKPSSLSRLPRSHPQVIFLVYLIQPIILPIYLASIDIYIYCLDTDASNSRSFEQGCLQVIYYADVAMLF